MKRTGLLVATFVIAQGLVQLAIGQVPGRRKPSQPATLPYRPTLAWGGTDLRLVLDYLTIVTGTVKRRLTQITSFAPRGDTDSAIRFSFLPWKQAIVPTVPFVPCMPTVGHEGIFMQEGTPRI